jgi:hypothetical protein
MEIHLRYSKPYVPMGRLDGLIHARRKHFGWKSDHLLLDQGEKAATKANFGLVLSTYPNLVWGLTSFTRNVSSKPG